MDGLLVYLPPLVTLCIGFFVKEKRARFLFLFGSGYFLLWIGISWVLAIDCKFNDFAFKGCSVVPEWFYAPYSVLHLINLAVYVFVGPILLIIAVLLALKKRA